MGDDAVIGLAKPKSFAETGDDAVIGLAKPKSFAEMGDDAVIGLASPRPTEAPASESIGLAVPPPPEVPPVPGAEPSATSMPPRPRPMRQAAAFAPPQQASVQQGLFVAALLVFLTGFGIFVAHKEVYDAMQAEFNTPIENTGGTPGVGAFGSTEEEAGELPPEIREMLEGGDSGYDYDSYESYDYE